MGIAGGLEGSRIMILCIAAIVGCALAGYLPYDSIRNRARVRQEAVEVEFGNIISKIALLVTAGMSIVNAIEETSKSGQGVMYDELGLVMDDIKRASTVNAALIRLQCRCDDRYLDKFVSVVAKSYVSGNANLAEDLRVINRDCWLEKKHNARRMGEAAQNKLFIPTMLMFVGLLVVVIVPAMSGFSFM